MSSRCPQLVAAVEQNIHQVFAVGSLAAPGVTKRGFIALAARDQMASAAAEDHIHVVVDHVLHDVVVPAAVFDMAGKGRRRGVGHTGSGDDAGGHALSLAASRMLATGAYGSAVGSKPVSRSSVRGPTPRKRTVVLWPVAKAVAAAADPGITELAIWTFTAAILHLVHLQVLALVPAGHGLHGFIAAVGNHDDHVFGYTAPGPQHIDIVAVGAFWTDAADKAFSVPECLTWIVLTRPPYFPESIFPIPNFGS
jgi:hypothetical protein